MAERTAKQKAATRRMIAANRAARGLTGGTRKKKGKKARKKGESRATRSAAATMGAAVHGRKMMTAPKGASVAKRLGVLEHNQKVLHHRDEVIAAKVMQHEHVLVAAGLLSARGRALGKGR